jgi:uncharacterized protein with NAD-binding domain and iron-sulfur cluster
VFSHDSGIAAGATLICGLRMLFTYKGAIFFTMQAGMGDVVFAPLYLVLQRRGVRFEFFARVLRLGLSADKQAVGSIDIARQATVKRGRYEPLFDVDGLPCWPSEPDLDQLVEGEAIRAGGHDLESFYCAWPNVGTARLEHGRDFDTVVLAISIGAFTAICPELLAHQPRMRDMVEHTGTIKTQAMQLWLTPTLAELGWSQLSPVMTAYAKPFDTWADMSHLLEAERWPATNRPGKLAYFCGYLDEARSVLPSRDDADYPAREQARVVAHAARWIEAHTGHLWPAARTGADAMDWSLLHDPAQRSGRDRLAAQYVRANVNPSDRYVQTLPGTTKYRLDADESGYDNLVFAGDWVRTRLNGGCIEAAATAGLQAARAVSGRPVEIIGDLPPRTVAPARAPSTLPRYIDRGGDIVIRAPVALSRATMYSFVLASQPAALRALCDRYLNAPLGRTAYVPAAPFCALVAARVEHSQSRDVRDWSRGFMSEIDVAFWVPLAAGRMDGGRFTAERLVWFHPYIFVDSAPAMAIGREIYGFPKQASRIQMPASLDEPFHLRVDAAAIGHYSPRSEATEQRLIELRGGGGERTRWRERTTAAGALGRAAKYLLGDRDLPPAFRRRALVDLVRGRMPMVFLQQFRDVEHPDRAAYQAVIEATAAMTRFRGAGLLSAGELELASCASHPIARDLGLAETGPTPLLATWTQLDFDMHTGKVLQAAGRAS